MLIPIEDITRQGLHFAGTISGPRDGAPKDPSVVGAIVFGVRLQPVNKGIRLTGWFRTHVRESCSRCLVLIHRDVSGELDVRLQPEALAPAESETELDETDLEVEYYLGESLDLRAILAQQIVLESPLKVLCDQDCKGLCSQCGTNLNVATCDCEPPIDPRLSKLIDLRDRL